MVRWISDISTKRLEPARRPLFERPAMGIELARGPLLEPTRAANGIKSARGPLFEPDAKRIEPARQRTQVWLESARLVHNTIPATS